MDSSKEILKRVTTISSKAQADLKETRWQLHLAGERIDRLLRENNDLHHAKLTIGQVLQRTKDYDKALPIISIRASEQGVQIVVGA